MCVLGGGGEGVWTPLPLKNHKVISFLSNTETHTATKPAFKVGPSSARERNAIYMRFA